MPQNWSSRLSFLLESDFSRLTGEAVLTALGQAFFSVGIAMAVHITYGSYLDRRTSIPRNAFIVVGAERSGARRFAMSCRSLSRRSSSAAC